MADGVDGLLVPAQDAAALASAMTNLYQDLELRIRLGMAAGQKALTAIDERRVLARFRAVYRELVPC